MMSCSRLVSVAHKQCKDLRNIRRESQGLEQKEKDSEIRVTMERFYFIDSQWSAFYIPTLKLSLLSPSLKGRYLKLELRNSGLVAGFVDIETLV